MSLNLEMKNGMKEDIFSWYLNWISTELLHKLHNWELCNLIRNKIHELVTLQYEKQGDELNQLKKD